MTPFDPSALLAMLLAFYPTVSPAALALARRERPEYFAAGQIIGSKGDKLQLPDGRVFDCIFAAGGAPGQQRWQAIDVTNDPGGSGGGFDLEAGPLVPMDDAALDVLGGGESFTSIVADELDAFGASDERLQAAATAAAEFDGAGRIEDSFARTIEPAAEHHTAMRVALDLDDPAEEFEAAGLSQETIDSSLTQYDEPKPDDLPEPDPGNDPEPDPGNTGRVPAPE